MPTGGSGHGGGGACMGGDADIWGCTMGSGCDMALHTRLRGQASCQQGSPPLYLGCC